MMATRAIFSLLLVLALTKGIHCGLSHRVLERLALPQLGVHTHNAASSAATAASTAYGSFRTYLTNLYPRLALQPSLVERIQGASSSSSSSASSSSGSLGGSLDGSLGGIRPIVEPAVPFANPAVSYANPAVPYASPAVTLPAFIGSELVSPGVVSPAVVSPAVASPAIVSPAVVPGVYPSELDSALVAGAPLVSGGIVEPANYVAY